MNSFRCLRPLAVHRAVKEGLLGRRLAGDEFSVGIELGEPARIEPAERDVGRSHQPTVFKPRADVAGTAEGQSARKQLFAEPANVFAQFCFA